MNDARNIGWTFSGLAGLAGLVSMVLGASGVLAEDEHSRPSDHHARSGRYNSRAYQNVRQAQPQYRHGSQGSHGHWQSRIGIRSPMHHGRTIRRWVSARYQMQTRRVLIKAGHYHHRHMPPVYGTRYDAYGRSYRVVIRPAGHRNVWVPAQYEYRQVKVRVPGRYETVSVRNGHHGHQVSFNAHGRF